MQYTFTHKQYTEQHKNFGRMWAAPRLCWFYPGICVTTEEKARTDLSQGSRRVPAGTMKMRKRTIRMHYTIRILIILDFITRTILGDEYRSFSSSFCCLGRTRLSVQVRGSCKPFVTTYLFYGEELLARRPTPKLEDHPLSAAHDCLFNIFAAALHIGGISHPQPEDAPCRGDRDPRITVLS